MEERLTKLTSEIPYTTASGMKLIDQIKKIIHETSWKDKIVDEEGLTCPNPKNLLIITRF
jgi:hypothetical protein